MREQAAQQPNSWLYVVDPIFTDPNAEVPPWGFIGGFRVDERGQLTEEFSPNPNYRPSPVALRLPAPANDVERALQLTSTGYAPGQTLLGALLEAELILFAQPQGDGLFTLEHHSGRKQLQVFTSEAQLPQNWTSWQRMTGRSLAGMRPVGVDLQVNPASSTKVRVPCEDLIRAAGLPVELNDSPASPAGGTPAEVTSVTARADLDGAERSDEQPRNAAPAEAAPVRSPESTPEAEPAPAATTERESVGTEPFGDRFLGSLLTAAAGDALGAPVEFYPVEQIRSRYGTNGVTDYDRGGEHAGEFTDDVQLTLFALEGMIRGHVAVRSGAATTPLGSVQLGLQRWLHTQGYSWQRAAGPFAETHPEPDGWLVEIPELFSVRSPASSSISALREFVSAGAPGRIGAPLQRSDSHGGVLRAIPAALWSTDPREVFELAASCAALTHGSPDGYLPAGVLAVVLRRLLDGERLSAALDEARSVLAEHAPDSTTEQALASAVSLAEHGKPTPERLKDVLGAGWSAPEALSIAVCAVLSTESLAGAVLLAVNHSGDSDSAGAICGALAGAVYGSSALPGVWLRDLHARETVTNLGKDALLEFGQNPPEDEQWTRRYPGEGDVSPLEFGPAFPGPEAFAADQQPPQEQEDPQESAAAEEPEPPLESAEAGQDAGEAAQPVAQEDQADSVPDDPGQPRSGLLGSLLGGAVGDALGYIVEFDSLPTIRQRFGPQGVTGFPDSTAGSAVVSDDTQMTLFTLDGIIRAGIAHRSDDPVDPGKLVQHAYQRWLHTQGFDWKDARAPGDAPAPDGWLIRVRELFTRRAPGTTCIQALHGFAKGRRAGSVDSPLNDSKGCGGVMRAAPAALWSTDPAEVFRMGVRTAVLTHGHPSGYLPAGALAVLVRVLLDGHTLREALDRALRELSTWDEHQETTACLKRAAELAAAGETGPEVIAQQLGGGWVGEEALGIAVHAAMTHPDSFADAVLLAVNHSGDSDSTASVCGNIMGAALSAESIPPEWVRALELRETIERIAADAEREFGPEPPEEPEWYERYPLPSAAENSGDSTDAEEDSARSRPRSWLTVRPPATETAEFTEVTAADTTGSEATVPGAGAATAEQEVSGLAHPGGTATAEAGAAEPAAGTTDEAHVPEATEPAPATEPGEAFPAAEPAEEVTTSGSPESAPSAVESAATESPGAERVKPTIRWKSAAEQHAAALSPAEREDAEREDAEPASTAGDSAGESHGARQEEQHTTPAESPSDDSPSEEPQPEQPVSTESVSEDPQSAESSDEGFPPAEAETAEAGAAEHVPAAAAPEAAEVDGAEHDGALSTTESRLLTAWRRVQEGGENVPEELYEGLRALAVEAFGSEEARRLLGQRDADSAAQAGLPGETPLSLDLDRRIAGCVLGTACGDAFGAPLIFTRADQVEPADPESELPEVFGGRGRGSAVTQQLVFVLHGALRAELRRELHEPGASRVESIRTSLRQWVRTQGVAPPAPRSATWPATLPELNAQRFPDHASLAALAGPAEHSSASGPLNPPNAADGFLATARAAPLGLFAPDVGEAFALGAETAVLTHGGPDGYLPAGALAGLVNVLSAEVPLSRAVERVLTELDKHAGGASTAQALRSALRLAERGEPNSEVLHRLGTGWQAPGALGIAVLAALSHPDSWQRAVALAGSHSGNSSATAAICGGLLGAARGDDSLPAKWTDSLELREVVDTLLADRRRLRELPADGQTPEWTVRYQDAEIARNDGAD
ncbi:type VII secretion system-associated protein [Actinopolyspora saharensis]|uniref:ADP-ribosylglycohydrolase n=1 Tax=Actinopolyspora saharensis TaxID=995062 RepID=A0A1H1DF71_9ACTN|nr:type VII secretion system-associated protein [Actinopolyspora saharensis]SDQ75040.1 ADP-ribosylglycohydrolase [Actinopolyspora saharensis]